MELTTLHPKKMLVTKSSKEPHTWTDSLDKRPKRRNMDMRFGLWNVRSLYRVGSPMTVSRELSKYKLDLVGVWETRWESSGTIHVGKYTLFCGKGNENHELGTSVFVHKRNKEMLYHHCFSTLL
jgi:hypothetical protein